MNATLLVDLIQTHSLKSFIKVKVLLVLLDVAETDTQSNADDQTKNLGIDSTQLEYSVGTSVCSLKAPS